MRSLAQTDCVDNNTFLNLWKCPKWGFFPKDRGAFPEAQKGVVIYAICLRKAAHSPNNNANPSGVSEKKSLLCRKSAILSIRLKKAHFGAFPEAQKANWRSQLHAQSSQMHSIPLGPSQKNSECIRELCACSCEHQLAFEPLGRPQNGVFPPYRQNCRLSTQ